MAGTTRDIRTANRFAVLRGVYAAGATTRQALADSGELSYATVSHVVAELVRADVLAEVAYEAPPMGRPRARLAVNAGRGRLVGVAIAETHLRVEVFDLALRPEWLLPAARAEVAARALPRASGAVQLLLSPIGGHRTCLGMATFALERFLSGLRVPSRHLPRGRPARQPAPGKDR